MRVKIPLVQEGNDIPQTSALLRRLPRLKDRRANFVPPLRTLKFLSQLLFPMCLYPKLAIANDGIKLEAGGHRQSADTSESHRFA